MLINYQYEDSCMHQERFPFFNMSYCESCGAPSNSIHKPLCNTWASIQGKDKEEDEGLIPEEKLKFLLKDTFFNNSPMKNLAKLMAQWGINVKENSELKDKKSFKDDDKIFMRDQILKFMYSLMKPIVVPNVPDKAEEKNMKKPLKRAIKAQEKTHPLRKVLSILHLAVPDDNVLKRGYPNLSSKIIPLIDKDAQQLVFMKEEGQGKSYCVVFYFKVKKQKKIVPDDDLMSDIVVFFILKGQNGNGTAQNILKELSEEYRVLSFLGPLRGKQMNSSLPRLQDSGYGWSKNSGLTSTERYPLKRWNLALFDMNKILDLRTQSVGTQRMREVVDNSEFSPERFRYQGSINWVAFYRSLLAMNMAFRRKKFDDAGTEYPGLVLPPKDLYERWELEEYRKSPKVKGFLQDAAELYNLAAEVILNDHGEVHYHAEEMEEAEREGYKYNMAKAYYDWWLENIYDNFQLPLIPKGERYVAGMTYRGEEDKYEIEREYAQYIPEQLYGQILDEKDKITPIQLDDKLIIQEDGSIVKGDLNPYYEERNAVLQQPFTIKIAALTLYQMLEARGSYSVRIYLPFDKMNNLLEKISRTNDTAIQNDDQYQFLQKQLREIMDPKRQWISKDYNLKLETLKAQGTEVDEDMKADLQEEYRREKVAQIATMLQYFKNVNPRDSRTLSYFLRATAKRLDESYYRGLDFVRQKVSMKLLPNLGDPVLQTSYAISFLRTELSLIQELIITSIEHIEKNEWDNFISPMNPRSLSEAFSDSSQIKSVQLIVDLIKKSINLLRDRENEEVLSQSQGNLPRFISIHRKQQKSMGIPLPRVEEFKAVFTPAFIIDNTTKLSNGFEDVFGKYVLTEEEKEKVDVYETYETEPLILFDYMLQRLYLQQVLAQTERKAKEIQIMRGNTTPYDPSKVGYSREEFDNSGGIPMNINVVEAVTGGSVVNISESERDLYKKIVRENGYSEQIVSNMTDSQLFEVYRDIMIELKQRSGQDYVSEDHEFTMGSELDDMLISEEDADDLDEPGSVDMSEEDDAGIDADDVNRLTFFSMSLGQRIDDLKEKLQHSLEGSLDNRKRQIDAITKISKDLDVTMQQFTNAKEQLIRTYMSKQDLSDPGEKEEYEKELQEAGVSNPTQKPEIGLRNLSKPEVENMKRAAAYIEADDNDLNEDQQKRKRKLLKRVEYWNRQKDEGTINPKNEARLIAIERFRKEKRKRNNNRQSEKQGDKKRRRIENLIRLISQTMH